MHTHTPGPWTLERDRAKSLSLYSGSTFIGEVYHSSDEASKEEQANAYLIAAAPEMLEALKASRCILGSVSNYDPHSVTVKAIILIEDAIAKAEGRN